MPYPKLALLLAALIASSASIVSAQDRKDGGSGDAKGQSERPADPKQTEPESSSHNADKPRAQIPTEPRNPAPPPQSTGPTHPVPPKKE